MRANGDATIVITGPDATADKLSVLADLNRVVGKEKPDMRAGGKDRSFADAEAIVISRDVNRRTFDRASFLDLNPMARTGNFQFQASQIRFWQPNYGVVSEIVDPGTA